MSFQEAIKAVLGNYAKFDGRARRSEFWYFFLFYLVVVFALQIVGAAIDPTIGSILVTLFVLAVIIPMIAVEIRRMHDTDHSGWWILVPIVNLVFALTDGTPGDNRFGPSPKDSAAPPAPPAPPVPPA